MNMLPHIRGGLPAIVALLWVVWIIPPSLAEVPKGYDPEQPFISAVEASAGESLDDLMGGFESETDDEMDNKPGATFKTPSGGKVSAVSLDGYAKIGASYNVAHDKPDPGETDFRGVSKLRGELQLELNMKFSDRWQGLASAKGTYDAAYQINGKKDYTDEVLDEYEEELELREAYIIGRLSQNLDIKIGRQIVVWGKSDAIRITDVLNPLDLREPGLTDLEDLRLPLTMTKLDYYFGSWNLSGIAIHEIRFDKLPAFGSDFYPLPFPLPEEDIPGDGGGNTEYGISLKGTFSGWDLSFFYADVYRDTPHVRVVETTLPPKTVLRHASVDMLGGAVNVALGSWIIKGEAAFIDGLEYANQQDEEYSRTDIMVGLEYYGFDDAVIILEVANRHINGFDTVLKRQPDQAQEDESQTVLRFSRTFLNETLEMEALLSFYGFDGEDGRFQRFTAVYDITDALEIKGGGLLYQSGDLAEFADIGDNDRIFMELKYSF